MEGFTTMNTPNLNTMSGVQDADMSDLMFDDIPDIAHVFDALEHENISISILRGIGGHSTRLEPYDEVRL